MQNITERYEKIVDSIGRDDVARVYRAFRNNALGRENARHLEIRRQRRPMDDRFDPRYTKCYVTTIGLIQLSALGDDNSTNNRKIRKIIEDLRNAGVCILSDRDGYWLSTDRTEILDFASSLHRRAAVLSDTAEAIAAAVAPPRRARPDAEQRTLSLR